MKHHDSKFFFIFFTAPSSVTTKTAVRRQFCPTWTSDLRPRVRPLHRPRNEKHLLLSSSEGVVTHCYTLGSWYLNSGYGIMKRGLKNQTSTDIATQVCNQTWAKDRLKISTTCLRRLALWSPIFNLYNNLSNL